MKQINKLSQLLLLCLFIFSCKKNNQNNNHNSLIIGRWNNLNLESASTTNPTRHSFYTFSKGEYIEFFDDGTLVDYGGDYFYYAYTPSIHSGTYSIVGNTLYITTNYTSQSFYDTLEIQTLTDRKLTTYETFSTRSGTEERWSNYLK